MSPRAVSPRGPPGSTIASNGEGDITPTPVSALEFGRGQDDFTSAAAGLDEAPADMSAASALMATSVDAPKSDAMDAEAQEVSVCDAVFYARIDEILANPDPDEVTPKKRVLRLKVPVREESTSPLSTAPPSPSLQVTNDETTDVDEPTLAGTSFKTRIQDALKEIESATPKRVNKRKGRSTPPTAQVKRTKTDRNAEAAAEVMKLPYQSIISINMPTRPALPSSSTSPIPEPDPANLPFGPTEDYHNSMIIHYLDEVCVTYTKAAELYSRKFPNDAVTDEAIRKRHIRCLLRLWKKYGLKTEPEIAALRDEVPGSVRKRGVKRAKGLRGVSRDEGVGGTTPFDGSVASTRESTPAVPAAATTVTLPPHLKRKHGGREFEKACIVVWRDADKMTFKQIRDKLEEERGWSLGMGTVEKYYYVALGRVHGRDLWDREKDGEGVEEEGMVEVGEKDGGGEGAEEERKDGEVGGAAEGAEKYGGGEEIGGEGADGEEDVGMGEAAVSEEG